MSATLIETPLERVLNPKLRELGEKALEGERLSNEEGLYFFSPEVDEDELAHVADSVRKARVGDEVTFATTYYVHPTNLCELSCPMCSFYAKPGWKKAWFKKPEDVEKEIREALKTQSINEIHVVGGLWRDCDLNYYQDLFSRIKGIDENLYIKALTPVEYDFLARLHKIPIEEVFEKMCSYGLGSLPGGGAEILVESIRKQVAPQKISSERFMEIHKIAHRMGIPSNITMLFGHVEDPEHIVTHFDKVRTLQDQTGGFNQFIPLKYHVENNALGKRKNRIKPKSLRRIYAASRLMVDNVPAVKILWNYVGLDMALKLLQGGGNDLSSTNTEEKIIVMAGGVGKDFVMTEEKMNELIASIGRPPLKVHSGFSHEVLC